MMKKRWIASLLLLSLSACSSQGSKRPNESYFTNPNDPDLAYVTRNGDNYGKEGIAYSYQEVMREASVDAIANDIDSGKGVFLFLHGDTCSHCSAAHDDMVGMLLDSGLEAYQAMFAMRNPSPTITMLGELASRYPAYAKYLNGHYTTPSSYFLDNEGKIRVIAIENNRESLQNLEEFVKNLFNFTTIYTFRTFDSYLRFAADYDCLAYVKDADDSFYEESVFPLAKRSSLHTAELQWEYFSEEDQKRCQDYFGENNLGLIQKGTLATSANAVKNPAEAGELVQSYYRA